MVDFQSLKEDMNKRPGLHWLDIEHLVHMGMVDKDLMAEYVELLQLDIWWKDHQCILESMYKLGCGFWLDNLHWFHMYQDMGQRISDCYKPRFGGIQNLWHILVYM